MLLTNTQSPSRDQEILQSNSADEYYSELTNRNQHFIDAKTQIKLRQLRVLVAGCGAAGGACTTPLARMGVTQFRVADNGLYEISNLNRQHSTLEHIGMNKATFHANRIRSINPHASVIAYEDGLNTKNMADLVAWADLIIDGVDVTQADAIQIKYLLHETAHAYKKPVLTPLDPGFCQMGIAFDYRNPSVRPLNGKLELCKKIKHPLKGLFQIFPLRSIPNHTLPLVEDLLTRAQLPASQIAMSADLLSAVIAATVLRFVKTGELISSWKYDLGRIALTPREKVSLWLKSFKIRKNIKRKIAALE